MDAGVLDEEQDAEFIAEAKKVIDDATDWAEEQPDPDPGRALEGVFATGEPGAGSGGPAAGPGSASHAPGEAGSEATEKIGAAFDQGRA